MVEPNCRRRVATWVLSIATLALGFPNDSSAQAASPRGLVVEAVAAGSAGARAGLQPGDVLTSWTRAASPPVNPHAASGTLASPFDLGEIEIEQAPRGAVTLVGLRAGQPLALDVPTGPWRIAVRPAMSSPVAAIHARARAAADGDRIDDAVTAWRAAADTARIEGDRATVAWLLVQVSTALRDADRSEEAAAALEPVRAAMALASDPAAMVALHEAEAQIREGQNDFARAEAVYRTVLAIRLRSGSDRLTTAKAMTDIAFAAYARGALDEAQKWLHEALDLQQRLAPGSFAAARTVNNLGAAALGADDLDTAAKWLLEAESLFARLLPDGPELADIRNNLGNVAWRRGELARAEAFHEAVLAFQRSRDPDSLETASSLSNLGIVASDRGRLADSERLFRQALAIIERRAPGSREEAAVHLNLGNGLRLRGDLSAAESHYLASLAIREKIAPDSLVLASTLQSLGMVAGERGDQTRAQDYVTRALALNERLAPDSLAVASTLNSLGVILAERGDLGAAETHYRRALSIRERQAPDSPAVASSLSSLGHLAETRTDLAAAGESYEAARKLLERIAPGGPDFATVLGNLGDLADRRGDSAEAMRLLTRALALNEQLAPGSEAHALALRRLGLHALKRNDRAGAVVFFERSIDALESQTARLGGSDEVRATYAGRTHDYYKDYIDTLIALDRRSAAFEVLERSRARALLMVLAERDLGFARDLPPEMVRARQELNAEYDRVQQALAELTPGAEADRLREKLRDLREASVRVVERTRAASPRLAALQYPQPLDLAGVQTALDPGTVLLSYAVGAERTLLFVIERQNSPATTARVTIHVLPIGEGPLRDKVTAFRRAIEQHTGASHHPVIEQGRQLFGLLIAPAEAAVAAADRVLISPDGPLHNLPFAALARPARMGTTQRSHQFLVEWKPVHTVISATVYAELKKARPASSLPASLIAFGDPKYPARPDNPEEITNLELRSVLRNGYALEPLPSTRDEVEAIGRAFGGRATTYLGADATEERAKSVGPARYLHFATHGLLDGRMPLNSALVLTIPARLSENTENGLLQAWEIFEQMRIDADLVTLSACETALGAELSGEGLVGLTRAFHYAGARSVLASLWGVADESTAHLMADLYRHLTAGVPKDEALRRAQRHAIGTPETSAPFHWAAFTLTGDWR